MKKLLFARKLKFMTKLKFMALILPIVFFSLFSFTSVVVDAVAQEKLKSLHFLIPGGAGGGWDGTARGVGEALTKSGLVGRASYENLSGGGGGKAIAYLIENGASNHNTIMVNSTPIIIRSLTKVFPQSFRDLTPIAGVIGDYATIVVSKNSDIRNMQDLVKKYDDASSDGTSSNFAVGGGSVAGGMDHLVAAMIFQAAGVDPIKLKYVAYDAGGKALAGLLSGEIDALSTGFSEAVNLARAGEIRILGVTSDKRIAAFSQAETMKEQGVDIYFVNWRGFFASPQLPKEKADKYRQVIAQMYETPEWEEVRARNGWENIHNSGNDFFVFLEKQEKEIYKLMKKLGFL